MGGLKFGRTFVLVSRGLIFGGIIFRGVIYGIARYLIKPLILYENRKKFNPLFRCGGLKTPFSWGEGFLNLPTPTAF